MSESHVVKQLLELLGNVTAAVYRFAKRHAIQLIACAIVVLIALQTWNTYKEFSTRHLKFLMGASTGSSVEEAESIKEEVEARAAPLMGKRYSLELNATGGYEANRKRVAGDEEGRLAGFAYDGFGESENVSIVLPLDKRYLHILCHKDFLAELESGRPEAAPSDDAAKPSSETALTALQPSSAIQSSDQRLDSIFGSLKPGRVYIGAPGSATRECAEIVLKYFGANPEKLQCHGVGGFDEMRSALNRRHVDMAFSSGGFNSASIAKIAADGKCILLGLNGSRDAIVQANPHLHSVNFQPNSYAGGGFAMGRRRPSARAA